MVSPHQAKRRGATLLLAVLIAVAAALALLPLAHAETTTPPVPTATTPTPATTVPVPTPRTTAPVPTTATPPTSTSTSSDSAPSDEGCSVWDYAMSPLTCTAQAAGSSVLDSMVGSLAKGLERIALVAMSWWVEALPVSGLKLGSTSSGLLGDINSKLLPIQVIGLSVSVMFFAARMAWNRKQSLTDDAEDGFKLVLRASLAVTFVPSAIIAGGAAGDELASWLIKQAAGDATGAAVEKLLAFNVLAGPTGLGTGLLLILFIVGILGMLLQLFFLAIRTAMLIVVVAGLPVAASFSGTGVGSQAYSKMISWSIAFCLFKPIGALCYYIAFKAGDATATPEQALVGLLLLLLAGFVLPSLMRLIGGGATGSMGAGASGAAGLGMAVGAGVAAASLGAGAASGGVGAASTGMSLAQRTRSGGGGGGGGDDGGKSSPPAPNPPVGPSPDGSGNGGGAADTGSGKNPLTTAGMAGGAVAGAGHAVGGEADASAPTGPAPTPPPPRMQSGWGEHQMVR